MTHQEKRELFEGNHVVAATKEQLKQVIDRLVVKYGSGYRSWLEGSSDRVGLPFKLSFERVHEVGGWGMTHSRIWGRDITGIVLGEPYVDTKGERHYVNEC